MNANIPLTGRMSLKVRDKAGNVIHEEEGKNLVVVAGFVRLASLVSGDVAGFIDTVKLADGGAVGSNLEDTELEGDIKEETALSLERFENELEYSATISGLVDPIEVNEYGLFGNSVMVARFTSSTISLFPGQSVEIVWSIRVGEA